MSKNTVIVVSLILVAGIIFLVFQLFVNKSGGQAGMGALFAAPSPTSTATPTPAPTATISPKNYNATVLRYMGDVSTIWDELGPAITKATPQTLLHDKDWQNQYLGKFDVLIFDASLAAKEPPPPGKEDVQKELADLHQEIGDLRDDLKQAIADGDSSYLTKAKAHLEKIDSLLQTIPNDINKS